MLVYSSTVATLNTLCTAKALIRNSFKFLVISKSSEGMSTKTEKCKIGSGGVRMKPENLFSSFFLNWPDNNVATTKGSRGDERRRSCHYNKKPSRFWFGLVSSNSTRYNSWGRSDTLTDILPNIVVVINNFNFILRCYKYPHFSLTERKLGPTSLGFISAKYKM